MKEEFQERDVIIALRACLMPGFEEAPTNRQKQIVWSYFKHIGKVDHATSYETTTNQLWLNAGKRDFLLAVKSLMEKDPLEEQQGTANDGRASQHRGK